MSEYLIRIKNGEKNTYRKRRFLKEKGLLPEIPTGKKLWMFPKSADGNGLPAGKNSGLTMWMPNMPAAPTTAGFFSLTMNHIATENISVSTADDFSQKKKYK